MKAVEDHVTESFESAWIIQRYDIGYVSTEYDVYLMYITRSPRHRV